MLNSLHIENIAIIEKADISFSKGLNVLTGETGAGKSIIIDSINAVLGNRTSRELVRTGADNALVSAVFSLDGELKWFADNDIPGDTEIILQRRISSDGKSVCRVCGMPVTAAQMRELASQLVDIHGQNDGLRLLDEKSHLGFLDRFGTDLSVLERYSSEYAKFCDIVSEIDSLTMDEAEKLRLSDSLKFTIDEIEKASIRPGEYDELCSRRDILRNSEKLNEALDGAVSALSDGDDNAVSFAQNAEYYISRAVQYAPELDETLKSLREVLFSLSNVSETVNDLRQSLSFSEREYDELEDRISRLSRLQKKYARDEEGLCAYLDECRLKLDDIEYSDDRLEKLGRMLDAHIVSCRNAAAELSGSRHKAAEELEKRIIAELRDLNMPSVRFAVDFGESEGRYGFDADGMDSICFVMSANAGEQMGRISKIASGGELSRIMLALKNVFAEKDTVQTMIFDEVDSGVSGVSAQRVAEKLFCVSNDRQVMCVTHLPQIAAMADNHFLVAKSEKDGRTFTEINQLDNNGRKQEIARLYGGDNITGTTLAAAEEQLNKAEVYKNEKKA